MTKHITITLTEDQAKEVREMVRWKRAGAAQELLAVPQEAKFRQKHFSEELAFYKRLETTLVKQLAKS